jgi:hypothetical protein
MCGTSPAPRVPDLKKEAKKKKTGVPAVAGPVPSAGLAVPSFYCMGLCVSRVSSYNGEHGKNLFPRTGAETMTEVDGVSISAI